MDDMKIESSIKKSEIPATSGGRPIDYSRILKAVATLDRDESLVLKVPQRIYKSRFTGLQKALKREFPNTNYKVTSRGSKEDEVTFYIYKP